VVINQFKAKVSFFTTICNEKSQFKNQFRRRELGLFLHKFVIHFSFVAILFDFNNTMGVFNEKYLLPWLRLLFVAANKFCFLRRIFSETNIYSFFTTENGNL